MNENLQLTESERRLILLRRSGYKPIQFARLTGVSTTMISQWMRGITKSRRLEIEFERITATSQKKN